MKKLIKICLFVVVFLSGMWVFLLFWVGAYEEKIDVCVFEHQPNLLPLIFLFCIIWALFTIVIDYIQEKIK